ncbi:hypothetical protein ACSQ67_020917 [Phaseolus vulgaris]
MQMACSRVCLGVLIPLILFHKLHASSSLSLSVEKLKEDVIVSSPKPTFTAGFYAVGQNAFCFAIWYTNSPNTLVWIANRDHPVNGKRSTLSLLKSGNLVLTDAAQFQVWSTNTAATSKQVQLRLQDNGNLVLLESQNISSDVVIWQSFDFPTDTLLPGQALTKSTSLVSSRSGSNHSSGFYKLFFDSENVLRIMYEGPQVSSVYWPDPWLQNNNFGNGGTGNGRSTYNDSRVAVLDDFGYLVSSDNFTFRSIDYGAVLKRRLTLDHDGGARLYSKNDGEENWTMSGEFRSHPCYVHGICGANSYCRYDPPSGRKCSCLPGHSWVDSEDWSQGCKPTFQHLCSKKNSTDEYEARFLHIPDVDFYGYDLGYFGNYSYQQCESLCKQLCECKGFQHSFSDENAFFQCYPKTHLRNGNSQPGFKGSFFLRLPLSSRDEYENTIQNNGLVCGGDTEGSELLKRSYVQGGENGSVKFMLWFASVLGGVELVCIFLVWCFLFRNNRTLPSGAEGQGYVLAAAAGFRKFSYSELKQATKGFSQEIGRGGGGTVYKAVLTDNQVVAIKRLHEVANQGESEFLAEISIIGRLNHMNLISMLGYCAEGKHRLLVYEYMENGSLAHNLSSASNALDWSKRYNIAVGTARGVQLTELEAESPHHERLVTWVREKRMKGSEVGSSWVDQIVDPALGSNYDMNEMEILATVALECVEEEKNARPSMSRVAEKLQGHHTIVDALNKE